MASYCGDIRAADRSPSPVPRRRPLTPRARNQRSYSRKSPSRSAINDVQPLEFSPIPVFPKRRRSITFADEDEVFVREERPYCTEQERFETADGYGRSNGAAFWDAEGGAGAEKPAFEGHTAKNQRDGYRVDDVSALDKNVPSTPMLRSRSASRQRRALRRQEAEREFSFYDDSFVEGYVNKLAKELEEEKERIQKSSNVKENEKPEVRGRANESLGMNNLQRAKEYLRSAAANRAASPTIPSARQRGRRNTTRAVRGASETKTGALRSTVRDDYGHTAYTSSDEENRPAQRVPDQMRVNRSTASATVADVGKNDARKNAQSQSQKRGISLVSAESSVLSLESGKSAMEKNSMVEDIEFAINRVFEERRNRSDVKLNRVVLDWDGDDSQRMRVLVIKSEGRQENERDPAAQLSAEDEPQRQRNVSERPVKGKSKSVPNAAGRPALASRGASTRAAVSNAREVDPSPRTEADDLDLLEEDSAPVLLRRPAKKPQFTCSVSDLSEGYDSSTVGRSARTALQQRPQRRGAASSLGGGPVRAPRGSRKAAPCRGRNAFPVSDPYYDVEMEEEPKPYRSAAARVPSRARGAVATEMPPPSSPSFFDDPLLMLDQVAFPSPGKFDEMVRAAQGQQWAGGVRQRQRRGGRMDLPTSIVRDRRQA